jgi:bifunctional non-homologous end joining protein LigD
MDPVEFALCKSITGLDGINADECLMEPKLDGIRIQIVIADGAIKLYTRTFHAAAGKLPKVEEALHACAGPFNGTILDGEAVYLNDSDTPDFGFTAECMGCDPAKASRRQQNSGKHISYVAFDIPFLVGRDLRKEPLEFRKEHLDRTVELIDSAYVRAIEMTSVSKRQHQSFVDRYGEGSVVKKKAGEYRSGRSSNFLKLKQVLEEDVVVMGMTPGEGKYQGLLGAIVFGQYKDGVLAERGRCSGMTDYQRQLLTANLPIGAVMVITHNGVLARDRFRHPRFARIRLSDEKDPTTCTWSNG